MLTHIIMKTYTQSRDIGLAICGRNCIVVCIKTTNDKKHVIENPENISRLFKYNLCIKSSLAGAKLVIYPTQ